MRRVDLIINAPVEKVAKIANDVKTTFKIMKTVESVNVIETIG